MEYVTGFKTKLSITNLITVSLYAQPQQLMKTVKTQNLL